MKNTLIKMSLVFAILFGATFAVSAVEEDKDTAAVATASSADSMDTDKDGVVSGDEINAATDADPTVEGSVDDLKSAIDAGKELGTVKDQKTWQAKLIVIAGFLAAIFKLLLSLIKVLGRNIPFFKQKKGKTVLKYSTIGLGALAGLTANLAFGLPIIDCLMITLSGPGAVVIHEYTKASKDTQPEPEPKEPVEMGEEKKEA